MEERQSNSSEPAIKPETSTGLPRTSGSVGLLWIGVVATMLVAAFAFLLARSRPSVSPPLANASLPVWHTVPDFSLTERDGRTVGLADLRGKIWVADFVFTRCAGPCPDLSRQMNSLQRAVEKLGPDVRLVSFSLDPEFDTPEVLRKYADRFMADPARWWFLTGTSTAEMHKLIKAGFLQPVVAGEASQPIDHSTYFVLVDRGGRIRGFYAGLEAESKPKIVQDIELLQGEPPPS